MTEYEYVHDSFDEDETVDIPDAAIGVTLDTFGKMDGTADVTVHARYLVPEGGDAV